jgi:cytochrome bd-type quinol oxidase subunit 2
MTRPSGYPRFTNWLAGLVAGTSSGFLVSIIPTLGVVLLMLSTIGVLHARTRDAGASGLLVGLGATIVVLLIRAQLACEAFDAVPTQGCQSPDVMLFLALGAGLAAAGVLIAAVAVARGGRA